jgi:hypothetical protein
VAAVEEVVVITVLVAPEPEDSVLVLDFSLPQGLLMRLLWVRVVLREAASMSMV